VENAVADRGELGRDVVRDIENLFHGLSLGGHVSGTVPGTCPLERGYASFSLTSWETTDPSARPLTWGMTSAITRPKSRMLVAPFSAIALSTISSSSSSASGSGMN